MRCFLLFLLVPVLCFGQQGIAPYYHEPATAPLKETDLLDRLIASTEKQLNEQKKLREWVRKFAALQSAYAENPQDKQMSFKLVKRGYQLNKKIHELHLTEAFDEQFLSELAFYTSIAEKQKRQQRR